MAERTRLENVLRGSWQRSRQKWRRRRSEAWLVGPESLEVKTPLAVDVSLTTDTPIVGGPTITTLTLTYSSAADAATLVVAGDFQNDTNLSWSVAGNNGTSVTGTLSGVWLYDFVLVVTTQERDLPSSSFVLSAPDAMSYDLDIGSLSVSGIGSVSIAAPLIAVSNTTTTPISVTAGSISFGGALQSYYYEDYAPGTYLGGDVSLVATAGSIVTQGITTSPLQGMFYIEDVLPGGGISMTAATTIAVGNLNVAAQLVEVEEFGLVYEADVDDTSGEGGTVTLIAGGAISVGSITGASATTIDQNDASVATSFRAGVAAFARHGGGVSVGPIRGSGAVQVSATNGPIRLGGDITTGPRIGSPANVLFVGDVELRRGVKVSTAGGMVTFAGRVDGRRPLAIAAGTGAVVFEGIVGGILPLAGLRFESAGSVAAWGSVYVSGRAANAFRHGIEIGPGVNNVRLAGGGVIRDFRAGQAIHAPAGTAGSTIGGFRIVNSGRPFFGFGDAAGTTLKTNIFSAPVMRAATARITAFGSGFAVSTPAVLGTGRSGDTVTLYADGVAVGSAVVVHSRWSITSAPVANGRRSFTVRALSPDGVAAGFSAPARVTIAAPPGAESRQLFVKTLVGSVIEINAPPTATIEELQRQVEARTGTPWSRQVLIFGGRPLEPAQTVADYAITSGSTLHLVVRSGGAA